MEPVSGVPLQAPNPGLLLHWKPHLSSFLRLQPAPRPPPLLRGGDVESVVRSQGPDTKEAASQAEALACEGVCRGGLALAGLLACRFVGRRRGLARRRAYRDEGFDEGRGSQGRRQNFQGGRGGGRGGALDLARRPREDRVMKGRGKGDGRGKGAWPATRKKTWSEDKKKSMAQMDMSTSGRYTGWGKRRDGRSEQSGGFLGRKKEDDEDLSGYIDESTFTEIDKPLAEDFSEQIDEGIDSAVDRGLQGDDGALEAIKEATRMAKKNKTQVVENSERGRFIAEIDQKSMRSIVPEWDWPQLFPHYRKHPDFEALNGLPLPEAGRSAPRHFFSKKGWDDVNGITKDVASLARLLELPRPSRVQNLTFDDVAKGRHVVIADQAGSGKTISYLLPLLQRYIFAAERDDNQEILHHHIRIVVLAPTADLVDQLLKVLRIISKRSERGARVHGFTGGHKVRDQRSRAKSGIDILACTPGRFRMLVRQKDIDVSECDAIVLDEVDVLLREDSDVSIDWLRTVLPTKVQWVFATATLAEAARNELTAFEALPHITPPATPGQPRPKRGLVWKTGAGLHKVSPVCEHVIVDCTPPGFYALASEERHEAIIQEKAQALAWHLEKGVLKDVEENRIVVFCNTIDNCRAIENTLRRRDSVNERTRARKWKVMVLHGLRKKQDYSKIVEEFNATTVRAADFFKKRIMVCTDRMSRGVDFGAEPVHWVVLFDWPRDATEYIRRVGRTARGGGQGGVLSFIGGYPELKMSKKITASAIKGDPLQSASSPQEDELNYALERFDPTFPDWRGQEAGSFFYRDGPMAAQVETDKKQRPTPLQKAQLEMERKEQAGELPDMNSETPSASSTRGPAEARSGPQGPGANEDEEWAVWTDPKWDGKEGVEWEKDGGSFDENSFDDEDDSDFNVDTNMGVSLYD
eukprot:TRINITY_DN111383_c0_g1_i1.p1 TRINITY_DN111383_c0_g1~~TRINITY_DN111383_c0_g1_i1.p1  ORF type:complete len:939 (+),score=199.80 TRINITY_DN111383_c0_g1_i1:53-2818(+)